MNTESVFLASERAMIEEMKIEGRRMELQEYLINCINQYAKDLIQPGEQCDPWTPEHIEEAIGNSSEGYRKTMFACLIEAKSQNLSNNHANHLALVSIRQLVNRYWTEMAVHIAKEKYGKNVDGLIDAAGLVC